MQGAPIAHMASQKQQPSGTPGKQRPRHVPRRTCIGCRRTDARGEFVRLVRADDGRVIIDRTGKQRGRGAYLCQRRECWHNALRRRSIERALRLERLHPDDRATLEQFMQYLEDTMVD